LQAVATTIKRLCRSTDVIARFGGDEFAVLVVHPVNAKTVGKSAERIINNLNKPFDIMGHSLQVGGSIGIAYYPDDAVEEQAIYQKADLALYEAKRMGRNTVSFYKVRSN